MTTQTQQRERAAEPIEMVGPIKVDGAPAVACLQLIADDGSIWTVVLGYRNYTWSEVYIQVVSTGKPSCERPHDITTRVGEWERENEARIQDETHSQLRLTNNLLGSNVIRRSAR